MQRLGKYEILDRLGAGGMAVVYRARDTMLDRIVALKVINERLDAEEPAFKRFLHEAKIAAGLTHPNIVVIYELGMEEGMPYIAMEYLPGRDLHQLQREGSRMGLRATIDVALQIARALDHAHSRGVIHRDIKPANIRLLEGGQAKLVDFGIAKVSSEEVTALTRQGTVLGTVAYMSPEQLGGETLGPSSDIFSFGVVLYELLTGRKPFASEDLAALVFKITHGDPHPFSERDVGVPGDLQRLVLRSLTRNREERYESFGPIIAELSAFQQATQEATLPLGISPEVLAPTSGIVAESDGGPRTAPEFATSEVTTMTSPARRSPETADPEPSDSEDPGERSYDSDDVTSISPLTGEATSDAPPVAAELFESTARLDAYGSPAPAENQEPVEDPSLELGGRRDDVVRTEEELTDERIEEEPDDLALVEIDEGPAFSAGTPTLAIVAGVILGVGLSAAVLLVLLRDDEVPTTQVESSPTPVMEARVTPGPASEGRTLAESGEGTPPPPIGTPFSVAPEPTREKVLVVLPEHPTVAPGDLAPSASTPIDPDGTASGTPLPETLTPGTSGSSQAPSPAVPTPTSEPSSTPTPAPSATPTPSPSQTPTETPTSTETLTPTESPTPTETATETPSPTATPDPRMRKRAADAKAKALAARTKAEDIGAQERVAPAVSRAAQALAEADKALDAGRFADAVPLFAGAEKLFAEASDLNQKTVLAEQYERQALYETALEQLQPIVTKYKAPGSYVLDLQDRAKEGLQRVRAAQAMAEERLKQGNVRAAWEALGELTAAERKRPEVAELLGRIDTRVQTDQSPPEIQVKEPSYGTNQPLILEVRVTDASGIVSVLFHSRCQDEDFFEPKPMQAVGNGGYRAMIDPARHLNKAVRYYVEAVDVAGNRGSSGSARKPLQASPRRS